MNRHCGANVIPMVVCAFVGWPSTWGGSQRHIITALRAGSTKISWQPETSAA